MQAVVSGIAALSSRKSKMPEVVLVIGAFKLVAAVPIIGPPKIILPMMSILLKKRLKMQYLEREFLIK